MRSSFLMMVSIATIFYGFADADTATRSVSSKSKAKAKPAQQSLVRGRSLAFIENRGQFDPAVKFRAQSGNKVLWFTSDGVTVDVSGQSPQTDLPERTNSLPTAVLKHREAERLIFCERFANGRESPKVEASAARAGMYNYFIGNDPKKWRTGVVSYSQILYSEVWPGVDVRFVAKGADIEQEFLVHPGANASSIQILYSGVDGLEALSDGSLIVKTKFGLLNESSLRIYQEANGHRTRVEGKYLISGGLAYTFQLGSYNSRQRLVIDPTLLFSTFIGGGGTDIGAGIAVDAEGNAYVAGHTQGPSAIQYPTTLGSLQATPPNVTSAVVSKFDPVGNLVYSTYLGSASGSDNARGIAVGASGEAYVTGVGYSGFPTTTNALQQSCGASSFVSKLNAAGTTLLYSTCVGNEGYGAEYGAGSNAIAVDGAGRAYITGSTGDAAFPVTSGAFQPSLTDQASAFVSVIDPSLSGSASLVYSTHLGGEVSDDGTAIAVDSFGNAYVTGNTASDHFPTTPNAFQTGDPQNVCYNLGGPVNRCFTGFVAKLNPALLGVASLIYSTYLGGSVGNANGYGAGDYPSGIAVDSSGNAYVGGSTDSANFPTSSNAFQTSTFCGQSGFVSKLNPAGSALVYSTFLRPTNNFAGTCTTVPFGLAIDGAGDAYVTGVTRSGSFPVTADAFQSSTNGDCPFLTELSPSGSNLIYSTYFGGSSGDRGAGIALDTANEVYLVGTTSSYDFPTTPGAFQTWLGGGGSNIFVVKFLPGAHQPFSVDGIGPDVGGNGGIVTSTIIGSGFQNGANATLICSSGSVVGQNPVIDPSGSHLTVSFKLNGITPGNCNVRVADAGGDATTLSGAFQVEQGGTANVWLDVIGRSAIRGGSAQTYYVEVGNRGSLDAAATRVWVCFPSYITWSSSSQTVVAAGQTGGYQFLAFDFTSLAVGSTAVIPLLITFPDIATLGHVTFQVQAWKDSR